MTASTFKLFSLGLGQQCPGSDIGGISSASMCVHTQQEQHDSFQGPFVSSMVSIVLTVQLVPLVFSNSRIYEL